MRQPTFQLISDYTQLLVHPTEAHVKMSWQQEFEENQKKIQDEKKRKIEQAEDEAEREHEEVDMNAKRKKVLANDEEAEAMFKNDILMKGWHRTTLTKKELVELKDYLNKNQMLSYPSSAAQATSLSVDPPPVIISKIINTGLASVFETFGEIGPMTIKDNCFSSELHQDGLFIETVPACFADSDIPTVVNCILCIEKSNFTIELCSFSHKTKSLSERNSCQSDLDCQRDVYGYSETKEQVVLQAGDLLLIHGILYHQPVAVATPGTSTHCGDQPPTSGQNSRLLNFFIFHSAAKWKANNQIQRPEGGWYKPLQ